MNTIACITLTAFSLTMAYPVLAQTAQKPQMPPLKYKSVPTYKVTGDGTKYPGLYGVSAKEMPTLLNAARFAGLQFTSAGAKTDTDFKEIQVLRPGVEHKLFTFKGDTATAKALEAFQIKEGDEIRIVRKR